MLPARSLDVRTADNVALSYEPAGLASRAVAFVLDLSILGVAVAVLDLLVVGVVTADAPGAGAALVALLVGGIAFVVFMGYFVVAETATAGRTPGKQIVGLRVLRQDGGAPGLAEALVRTFARVVDLTAVGPVVMFCDPRGRRLGDLAAGTVVVRERWAGTTAPAVAVVRTPDAGPPIDGLERLGLREHTVVRAFLSRRGLTPEQRRRLATVLAAKLVTRLDLPPQAPERSWPAELLVERLYLQLTARLEASGAPVEPG